MGFKKYPDICRLGSDENRDILAFDDDMIVIEEKVDGGNFSFWQEADGIHFGSRNRDLTILNDAKMFAGIQAWLRKHLSDLELIGVKINPDYIYYAEAMQKHTIHYINAPPIIGFDIRLAHAMNIEDGYGLFLARETREQEFNRLGIENVPLVWSGKVRELKEKNIMELIPKSKYAENILAEGVVIKNYTRKAHNGNHQLYAKVVRDEFKEANRAVFGSVKNKNSDSQKIIDMFCTDARIKKKVLEITNETGEPISLRLMNRVPMMVIKDVFKEESNYMIDNYSFIDIKEMRHLVPKKCLKVIGEMMIVNGQC
jgi:hypothetical protein